MDRKEHSVAWCIIKKMSKKNKIQKWIIVILAILLILNTAFGVAGGK